MYDAVATAESPRITGCRKGYITNQHHTNFGFDAWARITGNRRRFHAFSDFAPTLPIVFPFILWQFDAMIGYASSPLPCADGGAGGGAGGPAGAAAGGARGK